MSISPNDSARRWIVFSSRAMLGGPVACVAASSFLLAAIAQVAFADEQTKESRGEGLIFHAPFDDSLDAVLGADVLIRPGDTHNRKVVQVGNHRKDVRLVDDGRFGRALQFAGNDAQTLFFSGQNMGYRKTNWSGTVSFWLRLDPDRDLPKGYSDPLLITQKKWNDGAFFIDFDDQTSRTMRLGTFADYSAWNPDDTPWEEIGKKDRPLVPVARPPLSRERWTHVAFTFTGVNGSKGKPAETVLFVDGVARGNRTGPLRVTWQPDDAAIMVGINFVGGFDDLAVFDHALSAQEIQRLAKEKLNAAGR